MSLLRSTLPPISLPETILQFGEGAFLRGFVDWMVDVANEKGCFNAGVTIIQPLPTGTADLLNEQDGLYTLLLRGVEGGRPCESRRIITCVRRALSPYRQWREVADCFRNPTVRFVVSNTTEAGIVYADEPYRPQECPDTFPAKVAALLYERFQAMSGDPAAGLIFLPCELIDRNGDSLRAVVLQYADAWRLPTEFAAWVRESNHFLNTLVDRIVPGYPKDEAEQIFRQLGYEDRLLDTGEPFHLWVIEGPGHLAGELPLAAAGLNVVWTDDLTPYRTRKVRILNGAHTAGSLAAFCAGLDTVREMVEDRRFGPFVRKAIFDEILPGVPLEHDERTAYAQSVLERFGNPFVRHELSSIALNSVSKWRVRVLPSLLDYRNRTGRLPPVLTLSLAALLRFYDGQSVDKVQWLGHRGMGEYPIRDEPAVLAIFENGWTRHRGDGDTLGLVRSILAEGRLWTDDLTAVPGLVESVVLRLDTILRDGIVRAVEDVLNEGCVKFNELE